MRQRFNITAWLAIGLLLGIVGCNGAEPPADPAPSPTDPPPVSEKKGEPMANQTRQVWDAHIVYEGEEDQYAGQLAYDAGMLSVVDAESDEDRQFLEGVAEDMNALEFLVDLAPPQDSDAPRYSVGAVEYDRQHPEFEQVMVRKLRENHALRVEPAAD